MTQFFLHNVLTHVILAIYFAIEMSM